MFLLYIGFQHFFNNTFFHCFTTHYLSLAIHSIGVHRSQPHSRSPVPADRSVPTEVVISSPLSRALETTLLIFGESPRRLGHPGCAGRGCAGAGATNGGA